VRCVSRCVVFHRQARSQDDVSKCQYKNKTIIFGKLTDNAKRLNNRVRRMPLANGRDAQKSQAAKPNWFYQRLQDRTRSTLSKMLADAVGILVPHDLAASEATIASQNEGRLAAGPSAGETQIAVAEADYRGRCLGLNRSLRGSFRRPRIYGPPVIESKWSSTELC